MVTEQIQENVFLLLLLDGGKKREQIFMCVEGEKRKATFFLENKQHRILIKFRFNLPFGSKLFFRVQVIWGGGLPSAL
jgi:hypothetical protein